MDIRTLCLAVLSLCEESGCEIKKFFEDGFSHFNVAGFGSIYPALAQTHPTYKVRSDFLLQMILAPFLPPQRLDKVLALRMADIRSELEHIRSCPQRDGVSTSAQFAKGYARAVLQAGLDYIEQNRESLLAAHTEKD